VNAGAAFVPHGQSAKTMQPSDGALDDPARAAQATAVRSAALGQLRGDAAREQLVAMRLRIVATVALDELRLADQAAAAPL